MADGVHEPHLGDVHDEWVHQLLDTVQDVGASRVLVDSLGDLQATSSGTARFREYIYSLLSHCSRQRVSVMMTHETAELYGVRTLDRARRLAPGRQRGPSPVPDRPG